MSTIIVLLVYFNLASGTRASDESFSTMKSGFPTASSAETDSTTAQKSSLRVTVPTQTFDNSSMELSPWKVANASQASVNSVVEKSQTQHDA